MKFILSVDTCCDNFKSTFIKNNIRYFSMKFICDGIEHEDNYDSAEDYKNFYSKMNNGKHYSTAGVNVEEIKEYFLNIIEETNSDIVHIALSSGLSCTAENAKIAADEINERFNKKIYVIDSLTATAGITMLANRAIQYRNEDKSAEETFSLIHQDIKKNYISFFINELDHLKKGGRISGIAATLGKLMSIKPVLKFDSLGKLEITEKIMGTKKVLMHLYDRFIENYDGNSEIFILKATEDELAKSLKDMIIKSYPQSKITEMFIGPMICSHTGTSIIALDYIQKTDIF